MKKKRFCMAVGVLVVVTALAAATGAALAGCEAGGQGLVDAGQAPGCYACTLDAGGGGDVAVPAPDGADDDVRGPGDAEDTVAPGCRLPVVDLAIDDDAWQTLHRDPQADVEVPVVAFVDGERFDDSELELHGGYARTVSKKSYRLTLPEDDDDEDPRLDLFGAGREPVRRIVLQATWIDPTFVRNRLTFDLVRDMGGLAPRVTFVELRVNGAFHGLYTAIERVDRLYLRKQGLSPSCNLYKAENHNANWADKSEPLNGYDKEMGEDRPSDDLGALLAALTHTPATEADFEREVAPRLSLDDHRIWTAVQVFALNQDTFTKNYYLHHDPDTPAGTPLDRFRIVSWDSDATFGISWEASRIETTDRKWRGHDAFSPRLYGIAAYRRAYLVSLRDALDTGPLALDGLLARTAAWRARLAPCAAADYARWERDLDFDAEMNYLDASIRSRHAVLRDVVREMLE